MFIASNGEPDNKVQPEGLSRYQVPPVSSSKPYPQPPLGNGRPFYDEELPGEESVVNDFEGEEGKVELFKSSESLMNGNEFDLFDKVF